MVFDIEKMPRLNDSAGLLCVPTVPPRCHLPGRTVSDFNCRWILFSGRLLHQPSSSLATQCHPYHHCTTRRRMFPRSQSCARSASRVCKHSSTPASPGRASTINGVPQYPVQSQPHLHTASMELPSMLSLDGKDQSSPSRGLIHLQSTEKHPPSLFRSKITSLLRSNCFKSGQDCLTITDQPVWGGLRPLSNRLRTVNWLTDN